MKSVATLPAAALLIAMCLVSSSAFAPPAAFSRNALSKTVINMGLLNPDGDERKALTRDNEPDEFFSTNTDKMTDAEKIPIALAGLAGISLPFILGLIALYASK